MKKCVNIIKHPTNSHNEWMNSIDISLIIKTKIKQLSITLLT